MPYAAAFSVQEADATLDRKANSRILPLTPSPLHLGTMGAETGVAEPTTRTELTSTLRCALWSI